MSAHLICPSMVARSAKVASEDCHRLVSFLGNKFCTYFYCLADSCCGHRALGAQGLGCTWTRSAGLPGCLGGRETAQQNRVNALYGVFSCEMKAICYLYLHLSPHCMSLAGGCLPCTMLVCLYSQSRLSFQACEHIIRLSHNVNQPVKPCCWMLWLHCR